MIKKIKNRTGKLTLALAIFCALNFLNTNQAHALSIVTHVPEKYTDVIAGERFYFEIEIKSPENPRRKDLRLEYEIIKDDEVIAQSKVLKAVETQASFMDFIVIPESAEAGLHVINVKISDYENLSEEVSASFQVVSSGSEQIKTYFFVLLGAVGVVGGLVVWGIGRLSKS